MERILNGGLRSLLLWMLVLVLAVPWGCKNESRSGQETKNEDGWLVLGKSVNAAELAKQSQKIEDALSKEEGATVVVKGNVGDICPRGCWFYLQDDKDVIYVDVLGSLEVPQDAKGKKAIVQARVEGKGGGKNLVATTLLIKDAP